MTQCTTSNSIMKKLIEPSSKLKSFRFEFHKLIVNDDYWATSFDILDTLRRNSSSVLETLEMHCTQHGKELPEHWRGDLAALTWLKVLKIDDFFLMDEFFPSRLVPYHCRSKS
jgi:hypothetical protein